ncbi:type II/III secretion system protein [Halospina denitrificans]|uniref:Type II/III secretion system protein n=1 Tax=Halospina denitrificans TaxID=332522 RepID=A0A4R7JSF2_9GAMM|nr:secretin N-terminal domain-containing protein [Halospina denitrificans]TDT40203.1 type II/III secretion system protein [Halospina denitrificans]
MKRIQQCLILLALALAPLAISAAPETHVFELQHRKATSVLPQLQNLYGQEGVSFSPDGQSLTVRAEAEQLAEIKELLKTLDEPPYQVRMKVRHRDLATGSESRGTTSRVYSTKGNTMRSITVQDGQMARISSGRVTRVPVAAQGNDNPAALLEEVDLSSGFLVKPSVISRNQVELQIVAIRNEPVEGMKDYETAGVVTIRRANPGEWVELGQEKSSMQQREGSRVYATSGDANRVWEINVEVLKPRR